MPYSSELTWQHKSQTSNFHQLLSITMYWNSSSMKRCTNLGFIFYISQSNTTKKCTQTGLEVPCDWSSKILTKHVFNWANIENKLQHHVLVFKKIRKKQPFSFGLKMTAQFWTYNTSKSLILWLLFNIHQIDSNSFDRAFQIPLWVLVIGFYKFFNSGFWVKFKIEFKVQARIWWKLTFRIERLFLKKKSKVG